MRKTLWPAVAVAAWLAASGAAAASPPPGDDGDGMGGPPPAAKPGDPAPAPAPAPGAPAPAKASEDVLVLKDGTEIRGRITAEDDAGYAVKVGGALRVVDKSKVQEVRRGAPAAADAPGADGAPPAGPAAPDKTDRERRKERRRAGEGAPNDGAPGDGAPAGGAPPAPPPPLTEDARAWAKSCIDRLLAGGAGATDPAVQRSASEALRALGPAVIPVLVEARDGAADEKGKQVLGRVLAMIEKGGGKGPRPGPDGAPPGEKPGRKPEGKPGEPGPGADKRPDGPKPNDRGRGPALMERVKTDLGLDEAQTRTVGQALMLFGRDVRDVMMDARDGLITYEDARTRGAEMRTKLREDLKATLTAGQLDKLDGLLDEMGKRMGGGPPPKEKPKDAPPPK